MEKIKLNDTFADIVLKLSEGNPGAIRVCGELMKHEAAIDKASLMSPMGSILSLDTHAIYGPRIWILYKDVCGENITGVISLLRACQLGILRRDVLDHAIDNRGAGVDVADLNKQVREKLGDDQFAPLQKSEEALP